MVHTRRVLLAPLTLLLLLLGLPAVTRNNQKGGTEMSRFTNLLLASLAFLLAHLGAASAARADTVIVTFSIQNGVTTFGPAPGQFQPAGTAAFTPFGAAQFSANGTAVPNQDGTRSVSGTFTFDFGGGNSFTGTFAGLNSVPDPQGNAVITRDLTVTGGAGVFSMATGTLTGTGVGGAMSGSPPPAPSRSPARAASRPPG